MEAVTANGFGTCTSSFNFQYWGTRQIFVHKITTNSFSCSPKKYLSVKLSKFLNNYIQNTPKCTFYQKQKYKKHCNCTLKQSPHCSVAAPSISTNVRLANCSRIFCFLVARFQVICNLIWLALYQVLQKYHSKFRNIPNVLGLSWNKPFSIFLTSCYQALAYKRNAVYKAGCFRR